MKNRATMLARATDALEAKKTRDAQALAEIKAAVAALDAECADLHAAVKNTARALPMGDLIAAASFARFQEAQKRKVADLLEKRAALEAKAEARRQTLAQSNGEIRAVERLVMEAKKQEALQRRRSALRQT